MTVQAGLRIIGLGNPILGDDGVGWQVAERLRAGLAELPAPVEIDCLAVGGLSLMEHLVGCESAILIDAITSGVNPPGSVTVFELDDLPDPSSGHLGSAHDTSLKEAIQLGRLMGAILPEQIWVVAVECEIVPVFSEQLTPAVAAAVPQAARIARHLIDLWINKTCKLPKETKS